MIFALISYFMTGLKEDAGAFFIYLLVIELETQAALSISLALGIGFTDVGVALTIAPLTIIPFMVGSSPLLLASAVFSPFHPALWRVLLE